MNTKVRSEWRSIGDNAETVASSSPSGPPGESQGERHGERDDTADEATICTLGSVSVPHKHCSQGTLLTALKKARPLGPQTKRSWVLFVTQADVGAK